mgnify:CR=1 FL=1|tara:strand:+ start:1657 stop:1830 length:174 start_codon:yes stop_codon:yes gene_type:complete
MDEIKELTSKINDYQDTITKLKVERDRYEKKCFKLVEELNYRKAMLHQIEKIVFKNK